MNLCCAFKRKITEDRKKADIDKETQAKATHKTGGKGKENLPQAMIEEKRSKKL